MKKNIFKKIIALTYLTIFLLGIFIPLNQIFAQNITISANSSDFSTGKTVTITAKTDSSLRSKQVSFKSSPTGGTFSPSGCVTAENAADSSFYSCSVSFNSTGGTFKITASVFPEDYLSNEIGIVNGVGSTPSGATVSTPTDTTYTPLAPLPGEVDVNGNIIPIQTDPGCTTTKNADGTSTTNCTNPCPFGNYLNIMIKVVIGFAAVLAMVMIVVGGIEYMTSELVSSKEEGRERITNAILGLLIALGAVLILNTINPQLLNACLNNLPQATIAINSLGKEYTTTFTPINLTTQQWHDDFGINCTGSGGKPAVEGIARQFINQTSYTQDPNERNTYDYNPTTKLGTIYVDCSSFVDQVYKCAGLPVPGNTSGDIFSSANSTGTVQAAGASSDFTQLHSGDLVGWMAGEDPKDMQDGHVAIYIGGGNIIDTQNNNNDVTDVRLLSSILDRIKHVYYSNSK